MISPELAAHVARRRDELNAAFDAYRALHPRVDADDLLLDFSSLAEAACAALADRPGVIGELIGPLFGVSLELAGAAHPGGDDRSAGIKAHLARFISLFPSAVAAEPDRLLREAINAYRVLISRRETAPERWIGLMAGVSRYAPPPDVVRRHGVIAAWRCGLAEFREAAIRSISGSDPEAVLALLGISDNGVMPDPAGFAAALADNPWADPAALAAGSAQPAACYAAIGGCSAFGGVFAAPPVVVTGAGGVAAHDGARSYEITADRFGSRFSPAGAAPTEPAPPDPSIIVGPSAIVAKDRSIALRDIAPIDPHRPLPDLPVLPISGAVSDEHAVYLTTPLSYHVFVIGLPRSST